MASQAQHQPHNTDASTNSPRALAARHEELTASRPAAMATAPGTWSIIGDLVDHAGGVSINALTSLHATVAVSPREDDVFSVVATYPDREVSGTVSVAEIQGLPTPADIPDQPGSPAPTPPSGGLITRLGGLAWWMLHRFSSGRGATGLDVTIASDIPTQAGLGAYHATDAALSLVLATLLGEETEDAPSRARLADVCTQAGRNFSKYPEHRSRHTAALRGDDAGICVINYSDGSVTTAPQLLDGELSGLIVTAPGVDSDEVANCEKLERRHRFLDDAARAFGVESLRFLPDAEARVLQWRDAVAEVHGPEAVPGAEEVRSWLAFWATETARAMKVAGLLRSRHHAEVPAVLNDSQAAAHDLYGLSGPEFSLAQLLIGMGAQSARASAPGTAPSVAVLVEKNHVEDLLRDTAAKGLTCVRIAAGRRAFVHVPGEDF